LGLVVGYSSLPEEIPLLRPPWADEALTAPRAWWSVGRLPLLGVAQVGAATTMAVGAHAHAAWGRFWRGVALTAGAKTALECGQLLALGAPTLERALSGLTLGVVLAFLAWASAGWRRGELGEAPAVPGRAKWALAAWFVIWVGAAWGMVWVAPWP
jgi:hypothetical protein